MAGDIEIRSARQEDYSAVVRAIRVWWGDSRTPEQARELSLLVPRLFLQHFAGTSLVAERAGEMRGFLIGFDSADRPDESYIHFVGVDPTERRGGLARRMYERFFDRAAGAGRRTVRAITSPANTGSIAFHRRLGFDLEGTSEGDEPPVVKDYDGLGQDRVSFVRRLKSATQER